MGRSLPDGVVAVVKAECATCVLVTPVLHQLREAGVELTVFTQDDPTFPEGLAPIHDEDLAVSLAPRHRDRADADPGEGRRRGRPHLRLVPVGVGGAHRRRRASGRASPTCGPGCGSLSVDPDLVDVLAVRFGGIGAAQPPGRDRRARGRGRGALRPRLDRRPARGPADRGTRAADAQGHDPRARRGGRRRAARPRRRHRREGRRQRGDGRLQAGVPAGGPRRASRPCAPTSSTSTACSPPRCRSVR